VMDPPQTNNGMKSWLVSALPEPGPVTPLPPQPATNIVSNTEDTQRVVLISSTHPGKPELTRRDHRNSPELVAMLLKSVQSTSYITYKNTLISRTGEVG